MTYILGHSQSPKIMIVIIIVTIIAVRPDLVTSVDILKYQLSQQGFKTNVISLI